VLLALGKAPRLAASALAATLVPTTLPRTGSGRRRPGAACPAPGHFVKNLGLLGGLMLAAADTEGKPSLAWRAANASGPAPPPPSCCHQDITKAELADRTGRCVAERRAAAV